jgi:hypothetical protein
MKEAAGPETVCLSARYASYTATAARRREIATRREEAVGPHARRGNTSRT